MDDRKRGQSLMELVVSMAIFGIIAGIGLPAIGNLTRRAALRAAIARIYDLMRLTREQAISLEANRAIKFYDDSDGGWWYEIYDDGDGDGVLTADIASGIDPLVEGPEVLLSPRAMATIGIARGGVPDPDGGSPIAPDASPVTFSRSICSFSMDGSSTPGSIYIRTIGGESAVIRASGDGGRLTILLLAKGGSTWSFPS
jgi:prepilin-type N-terminal cleavage/methylation domain-containing protein